jgi:hypothetical protein
MRSAAGVPVTRPAPATTLLGELRPPHGVAANAAGAIGPYCIPACVAGTVDDAASAPPASTIAKAATAPPNDLSGPGRRAWRTVLHGYAICCVIGNDAQRAIARGCEYRQMEARSEPREVVG